MRNTQITEEKIRAYLASSYRLGHSDQDITLYIETRSDALPALLAAHNANCGAYITAFNPLGVQQSDAENTGANKNLAADLIRLGCQFIQGSSSGDASEWPPETSLFAFGLPLEQAKALGIKYRQDAIVWVGADAVPKLILLR